LTDFYEKPIIDDRNFCPARQKFTGLQKYLFASMLLRFIQGFIFAFSRAVIGYRWCPTIYSDEDFLGNCSRHFFTPRFDSPSIQTKPTDCRLPPEFQTDTSENGHRMNWTVSANGFHTAFNLSLDLDRPDCLFVLYIPPSSFLDIGDAQDREFPAPQPPKFHFFSTRETFFEVQHRYQPITGSTGQVQIFPPILFCPRGTDNFELVPVMRPPPFIGSIPIPSSSLAPVVFHVTLLLPIAACVVQAIAMLRRDPAVRLGSAPK
jgi:hypothetical protein